jgi:hypothetical protein
MVWTAAACTSTPDCSSVIRFEGPSSGELVLRATATGDTAMVPHDLRSSSDETAFVPAHRFVVREAQTAFPVAVLQGSPPEPLRRRYDLFDRDPLLSEGESFFVVPWGHDSDCRPVEGARDEWVPAGADAVLVVSEARFHLGRLLFDVLGDFAAYPYGAALGPTAVVEEVPDDASEWLTAEEYYDLLGGLPRMRSSIPRQEQLRQIEQDFKTGPERFIWTFPGTEVIQRARLWASDDPTRGRTR